MLSLNFIVVCSKVFAVLKFWLVDLREFHCCVVTSGILLCSVQSGRYLSVFFVVAMDAHECTYLVGVYLHDSRFIVAIACHLWIRSTFTDHLWHNAQSSVCHEL